MYQFEIENEKQRIIQNFPKLEKENRTMKNEILELIQVIKYYQKKDFKVDEDEVEKCMNRILKKYWI